MFTRKMNTWKNMKKKALKHMCKTNRKQLRRKKTGLTEVYDYNKNQYRALSTARNRKTDFITSTNNPTSLKFKIFQKVKENATSNISKLTDRVATWQTKTFNIPASIKLELKDMFNSKRKMQLERIILDKAKLEVHKVKNVKVILYPLDFEFLAP